MNQEVHIVPIGINSWAVNVGGTSYQAFDSEEKALKFGQTMAAKSSTECKIFIHDQDGIAHPVSDSQCETRH